MIRAPRPAKWGSAKTFCASHNMVLPHPINKYENRMLAVAGSTWLDVNVNDIFNEDNKNFNNWVRRQRGWMNSNGVWSALLADSVQNYFCVKPDEMCDSPFGVAMFGSGTWHKMQSNRKFEHYTQQMAHVHDHFAVNTVLTFQCGNKWTPQNDASFSCVRGKNGLMWVRCKTKRCTQFDRTAFNFANNAALFNCYLG